jgi:O-antigen/teichoic acid export membrane protein
MRALVLRGAALSGIGYGVAQALNLVIFLVLARLATPDDFGVLAAGMILVGVSLLLTETGMMAAIVHHEDDGLDEAVATATYATIAGGILFSLLAAALAPVVGLFFRNDQVTEVAAVMSGLIFLKTLTVVPAAVMQRSFTFVRRLVVEPGGVIALGIGGIVATANGLGVWGLVIGYYALGVTEVLLSWLLIPERPRLRLASFAVWRELAGYGRHVLASEVLFRAGDQVNTAIVGRGLGEAALGQWRYALRLAATPYWLLQSAASYVLFPALARLQHEGERFRSAFVQSWRWSAVCAFPAGAVLLVTGEALAVALFGEPWRAAGVALAAMSAFPIGSSLASVASEAFKASGRPHLLTRMQGVGAGVTVLLVLALAQIGLAEAAAGLSAGAMAGAAYGLWALDRRVGIPARELLGEAAPPLLAAAGMVAVMYPLEIVLDAAHRDSAAALALVAAEILAGLAAYLAMLGILAPKLLRELASGVRGVAARLRRGGPPPASDPAGNA